MSSVLEKSATSVIEKRSFFLRTSSIQKIKCSATYPFRLAGTKLNKDAIKELFETQIISGRVLSQKALLNLYIITLKLVGALVSVCVGEVSMPFQAEVCDKTNKTELSFQERLLQKAAKLQKHKNRLEPKTQPQKEIVKVDKVEVIESRVDEFQTEIDKLKGYSVKLKDGKSIPIVANRLALETLTKYCFTFFVYACASLIYLQFLLLAIALNTTIIPPGLIFLISSLLVIAVIAFKVFLLEKAKKTDVKTGTKQPSTVEKTEKAKTEVCTSRHSRSRLKKVPVIDLDSKTLSKIKLL